MSRMKDLRIYMIEKVQKIFPNVEFETAETILDVMCYKHSYLVRKWTNEYIEEEGL